MALFGSLGSLIALVCAVWVIYDVVVNNKGLSQTAKIVWIVCAIVGSVITAIVYYFVGMKK